MPHHYLSEQLAHAHRQALLREAQQEQLLNQLPQSRHNPIHAFIAKLNAFVLNIETRLKQFRSQRQDVMPD